MRMNLTDVKERTSMKEQNNPRKPIIYFYIVTLVIVMLLNAYIFRLL